MTDNFEKYNEWILNKFENGEKICRNIEKLENLILESSEKKIDELISNSSNMGAPIRFILEEILFLLYKNDIDLNGENPEMSELDFKDLNIIDKLKYLDGESLIKDKSIYSMLHNVRVFANVCSHQNFSSSEISPDHNVSKSKMIQSLNEISIILNWLSNSRERVNFITEIYFKRNEVKDTTELTLKEKVKLEEDRGIKINDSSIINILYNNENEFKIPLYQRGYAWTEKELKTLYDDIERRNSSEMKHHFFGNVSFIAIHSENRNTIKIVDGQQRLTTILIILKAIHNKYFKILKDKDKIDENLNNFISSELPLTRIDDKVSSDVLEKIWNGEEIINKLEKETSINKAFVNVTNWLAKKNLEELDSIIVSISKFIVGVNWIKDANEFELFESLNSKGRKLSNYDIFKNYIYSLIDKNIESENEHIIVRKFETIIESKFMLLNSTSKRESAKEKFMQMFIEYSINVKVNEDNIFNPFKSAMRDWRERLSKPVENLSLDEFEDLLLDISKFIIAVISTQTGDLNIWKEIEPLKHFENEARFIVNASSYNHMILHYIFTSSNFVWDGISGSVEEIINKDEFSKILRLIEIWKVRRDIAFDMGNETIGSKMRLLNKKVKTIEDNYYIEFRDLVLEQDGLLKMPSVEKFKERLSNGEINVKSAANNILYRILQSKNELTEDIYATSHIIEPADSKRSKSWNSFLDNCRIENREILNKIGNFIISVSDSTFKKYPENDYIFLKECLLDDNFSLNLSGKNQIPSINEINQNMDLDFFINKRSELIAEMATEIFRLEN